MQARTAADIAGPCHDSGCQNLLPAVEQTSPRAAFLEAAFTSRCTPHGTAIFGAFLAMQIPRNGGKGQTSQAAPGEEAQFPSIWFLHKIHTWLVFWGS